MNVIPQKTGSGFDIQFDAAEKRAAHKIVNLLHAVAALTPDGDHRLPERVSEALGLKENEEGKEA